MRSLWLLVACLIALSCNHRGTPEPKQLVFWHWHSPFVMNEEQAANLRSLGVSQLFVRAATFSNDGERLVPILAQRFERLETEFRLHLVYNMDAGALRHFESFEATAIAKVVSERFIQDSKQATKQGATVIGVQLDFDVPTRLLPKYAEVIREIKQVLPDGQKISITSLPTWFSSGNLALVVNQTDFYAPQFYDTEMPAKLTDVVPILDRKQLDRSITAAQKLGRPYYAGISSFGRALLYDPVGNLQGTYLGLSPDQAMRHPNFELEDDASNDVERILTFVAKQNGPNGKGKGWHLVFRIPEPAALGDALKHVRQNGGPNCLGAALFRIPEPEETMVLPLATVLSQVKREQPQPILELSSIKSEDPWQRIETGGGQGSETRIHLTVRNVGSEPLRIGRDCLVLTIEHQPGEIEEIAKGQFDTVLPSRNGQRSSLKSANQVLLTRYSLNVGEKASIGPILVKPGTLLNWSWSAVTLSGGKASGKGRIDSNGKEVVGLENGASRPGSR